MTQNLFSLPTRFELVNKVNRNQLDFWGGLEGGVGQWVEIEKNAYKRTEKISFRGSFSVFLILKQD